MQELFVKIWEEEITIPTYPIGSSEINLVFLEKRVSRAAVVQCTHTQ